MGYQNSINGAERQILVWLNKFDECYDESKAFPLMYLMEKTSLARTELYERLNGLFYKKLVEKVSAVGGLNLWKITKLGQKVLESTEIQA